MFDVGPSLYLMSKDGKVWVILFIFHFQHFYKKNNKKKPWTYIKNLHNPSI